MNKQSLRHFAILTLIFCFSMSHALTAQIIRSVASTTMLTPPYSLYLSDYYETGSRKCSVSLMFKDLNEPSWDVYLSLKIESMNLKIQSSPNFRPSTPINLIPGTPTILSGEELAEYFNINNLDFSGITKSAFERVGHLPEGLYTFSFEAKDYNTGKIISNSIPFTANIQLAEPPKILLPSPGNAIKPMSPQFMTFQWQLQNADPATTEYILNLYEIIDSTIAPLTAVANNQVRKIFVSEPVNFTTFQYNELAPQLEEGKKYAYYIQAINTDGKQICRNDGKSETSWFSYGYPQNGKIQIKFPEDKHGFTIREDKYFNWTAPNNLMSGQQFKYEIKIVEINDSSDIENAIINNEPFFEQTFENIAMTTPHFFNYDGPNPKFLPTTKYAWQVKSYSDQQEIAKSTVSTFIGPPCIESFKAGNHVVYVSKTNGCDYNKLTGEGQVLFSKDKKYHKVFFENITIKQSGAEYNLERGYCSAPCDIKEFKLTAEDRDNGDATFITDSLILDKNALQISGIVKWNFPHAVNSSNKPIIASSYIKLNYNTYSLSGVAQISPDTHFDLLDPFGFKLVFNNNSSFIVRGQNSFILSFNGTVEFPSIIKGTKNKPVYVSFSDQQQLFYIKSNIRPDNFISPIANANIGIEPLSYIIDFSEKESPAEYASNKAWKGIFYETANIRIDKLFDQKNQLAFVYAFDTKLNSTPNRQTVSIDAEGLNFRYTVPLTSYVDKGFFNTFPSIIHSIDFNIVSNSINNSFLKGNIKIPVISDSIDFSYTVPITNAGFMPGSFDQDFENYKFNLKAGEDQNTIITINRAAIANNERIDMAIDIEWPKYHAILPQLMDFKVWGNGEVGFNVPNGATSKEGQILVSNNNLMHRLFFRGVKIDKYKTEYFVKRGYCSALSELKVIALTPKNQFNGDAVFSSDSIILFRSGLQLRGNVKWNFPHPTTLSENTILNSGTSIFEYNTFFLKGKCFINPNITYELKSPAGFKININSTSTFTINESNRYFTNFNGFIELPNSIKNIENKSIRLEYKDQNQLTYIESDIKPENYITPFTNANITIEPSEFTIDLSNLRSPTELTLDKMWKGVYFTKYDIRCKSNIDSKNQLMLYNDKIYSITSSSVGDTLAIDGNGLHANVAIPFSANDLAIINTFQSNIQQCNINIYKNIIRTSNIKGSVKIPILSDNQSFTYIVPLTENGFETGYFDHNIDSFRFPIKVKGREEIAYGIINKATFANLDHIDVNLGIDWPVINTTIPSINGFKIWSNGNVGFGTVGGFIATDGNFRFTKEKKNQKLHFQFVRVERSGNSYILERSNGSAPCDFKEIKLVAETKENGDAFFVTDSVVLIQNDLKVGGYIRWDFPHAVNSKEKPSVFSKHTNLSYSSYSLVGQIDINDETSFELLDPFGFKIKIDKSSNFTVREPNTYSFSFNGTIELPEIVKGTLDNTLQVSFKNQNQLYYIKSDIKPDILIAPISNADITLEPIEYIIDLSDNESPIGYTSNKQWKGVSITKSNIKFNNYFDKKNQIALLAEKNVSFSSTEEANIVSIDGDGLNLKINVPFSSEDKALFNTFPSNLTSLNINIDKNSVTNSSLKGNIKIPIISESVDFAYTVPVTNSGFMPGSFDNSLDNYKFQFNANAGDQLLNITIKRAVFANKERLDMTLDIEWPKINANLNSLNGFKIWGNYDAGFNVPGGAISLENRVSGKLDDMVLFVDGIGVDKQTGVYAFGLNATLNMSEDIAGENGPPVVNFYSIAPNSMLGDFQKTYATAQAEVAKEISKGTPSQNDASGASSDEYLEKQRALMKQQNEMSKKMLQSKFVLLNNSAAETEKLQEKVDEQALNQPLIKPLTLNINVSNTATSLTPEEQTELNRRIGLVVAKSTKYFLAELNTITDPAKNTINSTKQTINNSITSNINTIIDGLANNIIKDLANDTYDPSDLINELANTIKTETDSTLTRSVNTFVKNEILPLLDIGSSFNLALTASMSTTLSDIITGNINFSGSQFFKTQVTTFKSSFTSNFNTSTLKAKLDSKKNALLQSFDPTKIVEDIYSKVNSDFGNIAQKELEKKAQEAVSAAVNEAADKAIQAIAENIPLNFDGLGSKLGGNGKLSLDPSNIAINTGIMSLTGQIKYTPNDPKFGNIWKGDIVATIKSPVAFSLPVVYITGKKDGINYWFCQVNGSSDLSDKTPKKIDGNVTIGPVKLEAAAGRVYHNMKDEGNNIVPDKSVDYGASLSLVLFDSQNDGKTLRMALAASYVVSPSGDYVINFDGNCQIKGEKASYNEIDQNAVGQCEIKLSYNSAEHHFLGYGKVVVNKPGVLCAQATLNVDIAPGKWSLAVGTKENKVIFVPSCQGWSPTGWLFVNQSEAELGLGIKYAIKAGVGFDAGAVALNIAVEGSVAFGIEARVQYKPSFALMSAGAWAELWAKVLVKYKIDLWLAEKNGEFTLVDLYAKANLLIVFNPPPTTIEGNVAGYIKLCGIVSCDFDATFKKTL